MFPIYSFISKKIYSCKVCPFDVQHHMIDQILMSVIKHLFDRRGEKFWIFQYALFFWIKYGFGIVHEISQKRWGGTHHRQYSKMQAPEGINKVHALNYIHEPLIQYRADNGGSNPTSTAAVVVEASLLQSLTKLLEQNQGPK